MCGCRIGTSFRLRPPTRSLLRNVTTLASTVPSLPVAQANQLLKSYADVVAAQRRKAFLSLVILFLCILVAAGVGEVRLGKLASDFPKFFDYIGRLFYLDSGKSVFTDPYEWFWGVTQNPKWLKLLLETILIAYLGTLMGFIGAFCCSFLAARNMGRSPWIAVTTKRLMEFSRTVPELVFALIFVVAFGLGPLPGVIALTVHSMGSMSKLFTEVVENIDMRPVEGLRATGASWTQMVRFAAVPQVLSSFASYGLLRFEINVREASIMGFVGAGGIGDELLISIRKFYYSDVSAILILLMVTVMLIDLATERLRHRLTNADNMR